MYSIFESTVADVVAGMGGAAECLMYHMSNSVSARLIQGLSLVCELPGAGCGRGCNKSMAS